MNNISIDRQIACVKREIAMRKRVYPRWVDSGRMIADKARFEIEAMQAVLMTLEWLAANNSELERAVETIEQIEPIVEVYGDG